MNGLVKSTAVIVLIAFSVITGGMDSSARASDASLCTGQNLGAASCFSGKLCACIHDRGGSVTGTPAGFRWDCGVLRPKCDQAADAPANPNEFKGPYPQAIGIDRSDNSVQIKQRQNRR